MMKKYISIPFLLILFLLGANYKLKGQTAAYTGYRIYLAKIQVLEEKEDKVNVRFTPINTGRKDLSFGELDETIMNELVLRIDAKYKKTALNGHQKEIKTSLQNQSFTINAGQVGEPIEMEVLIPSPSTKVEPIVELDTANETNNTEITDTTVVANTTTEDIQEEAPRNIIDTENCGDLVFDSVTIKKQNKNTLVLEYIITNKGNQPVDIEGKSRSNTTDNLGVKAYMTRSEKLPKGAVVLGGDFVKNRGSKHKGVLQPGESHTSTIRLDAFNITKFTPFVILELDAFRHVQECDETNNRISILVK